MNNQDYWYSFPVPPDEQALEYYRQDAYRVMGDKLAELLITGERFTVRLREDTPPKWQIEQYIEAPFFFDGPPEYKYWLEIGAVHEREIIMSSFPDVSVSLPKSSIKATPAMAIITELIRRLLLWTSYFTAAARIQDKRRFDDFMSFKTERP